MKKNFSEWLREATAISWIYPSNHFPSCSCHSFVAFMSTKNKQKAPLLVLLRARITSPSTRDTRTENFSNFHLPCRRRSLSPRKTFRLLMFAILSRETNDFSIRPIKSMRKTNTRDGRVHVGWFVRCRLSTVFSEKWLSAKHSRLWHDWHKTWLTRCIKSMFERFSSASRVSFHSDDLFCPITSHKYEARKHRWSESTKERTKYFFCGSDGEWGSLRWQPCLFIYVPPWYTNIPHSVRRYCFEAEPAEAGSSKSN